eukprot:scaffold31172_cov61-Phaeocystis_antarctica.AAC.2
MFHLVRARARARLRNRLRLRLRVRVRVRLRPRVGDRTGLGRVLGAGLETVSARVAEVVAELAEDDKVEEHLGDRGHQLVARPVLVRVHVGRQHALRLGGDHLVRVRVRVGVGVGVGVGVESDEDGARLPVDPAVRLEHVQRLEIGRAVGTVQVEHEAAAVVGRAGCVRLESAALEVVLLLCGEHEAAPHLLSSQLLWSEALIGHRLQGVLGEAVVDELPLPRRAVLEGTRLEDGLRQLAAIAQDAQLP